MARGRQAALLTFGLLLALLPAALGVTLVGEAYFSVFFGQRIDYLKHGLPATSLSGLRDHLGIPAKSGENIQTVPRVFLASLPENLVQFSTAERKEIFIAAVLPLLLRSNELILEDRARMMRFRKRLEAGRQLSQLETRWLLALARKYKMKGVPEPAKLDWDELALRVDVIPPSLGIAQAAIESGWGTSRFALAGNAIYGQWVWGNAPGLVPLEREEGADHKVRSFDFLIESVLGYSHNLNTHSAYEGLRQIRAKLRAAGQMPEGRIMAEALAAYSARGEDYVVELKSIIRTNRFDALDHSSLAPLGRTAAP